MDSLTVIFGRFLPISELQHPYLKSNSVYRATSGITNFYVCRFDCEILFISSQGKKASQVSSQAKKVQRNQSYFILGATELFSIVCSQSKRMQLLWEHHVIVFLDICHFENAEFLHFQKDTLHELTLMLSETEVDEISQGCFPDTLWQWLRKHQVTLIAYGSEWNFIWSVWKLFCIAAEMIKPSTSAPYTLWPRHILTTWVLLSLPPPVLPKIIAVFSCDFNKSGLNYHHK